MNHDFLAKILGFGILAGSIGLKVPEILNIYRSKNVNGISSISYYGGLMSVFLTVMYHVLQNNPFSSYGENVFILIQNFVLVLLLWVYMKPPPSIQTVSSVVGSFVLVGVLGAFLPPHLRPILNLITLPLSIASIIPQIVQNAKNKTTGQLSIITQFLNFIGSLVRIFTTIQEVGWDFSLLFGFLIGSIVSSTLIAQILYYNNPFNPGLKGESKED